jgi:hypothetical protein
VDRPLLAAALAYGAATAYGARVAVRDDVPGEPLGVRAGGRVGVQLAVGWGAGVSAPWPMAVAAVGSALRPGRGPGTAAVALGAATVAGQLVEPVAWGRRPSSPAVTRSLALNMATSAGLVLAGRRRVLAARRPR